MQKGGRFDVSGQAVRSSFPSACKTSALGVGLGSGGEFPAVLFGGYQYECALSRVDSGYCQFSVRHPTAAGDGLLGLFSGGPAGRVPGDEIRWLRIVDLSMSLPYWFDK